VIRAWTAGLVAAFCTPAAANNGLLFIGFGSESLGMGGADTAVARDTTALNTNPAGLGQLRGRAFDAYGTATRALDVGHKDALGNDAETANRWTFTGGTAYGQRIEGSGITWGAGVFVQGGAGNKFENLATAAGTRDEISTRFVIFKLGPGAAYEVSERLRVGASVAAVIGRLEQKLFPNTNTGIDAQDLAARGVNVRLGAQYVPCDHVTLALVYSPKTELDFKDGTLKSNQSGIGAGIVTYRDARIEGFALPQELSFGAAWRAERVLVSFKLAWLNWDDAINQQSITASDPDRATPVPTLRRDTPLNWKDQYVWALGLAYTPARTTYYGGLNIANNPVPPETLTPLLSAAIARRHLTAGVSHPLGDGWRASGGMLYVFPEKVSYTNPSLAALGSSSEERIEYLGVNFMVGKTW
jgi:long-chain fatty acid transport protein